MVPAKTANASPKFAATYLLGSAGLWVRFTWCQKKAIFSQLNPPIVFPLCALYSNVLKSMLSTTGIVTVVWSPLIRVSSGSNQSALTSQCESRKVITSPLADFAPSKRARISPSRLAMRSTRTLFSCNKASSSPFLRSSENKDFSV